MKSAFLQNSAFLSLIGMALAISSGGLARATTIEQVCGPESSALNAPSGQKQNLCKAAYLNANSYVRDDNNSRVHGAVAVVCAFGCIGGVSNSCAGSDGGGSPCAQAMGSGRKAYEYSRASDADRDAAKRNGGNAHALESGVTEMNEGGGPAPVEPARSGSESSMIGALSKSCKSASETGSVSSRIDCAMASDPSIPKFVKTERFRRDFQQATGKSLDEVINKTGPELLNNYAAGAAEHAAMSLKGKSSIAGIFSRAGTFVKEMIGGVDEQMRGDFARAIVPPKYAGLVPVGPSLAQAPRPAEPASSPFAMIPTTPAADPDGLEAAAIAAPGDSAVAAAPVESRAPASVDESSLPPEENRTLSIFARVSRRYHDVWERISSVDSVFKKGSHI